MHRMPVLTALAAVLASFLIVNCLEAQPFPRRFGTITSETTIDEIPRHPLGLTNQIGTIQLSCTNDGRRPPGAELESRTHVMVDLMVSLNANIANRIDFGEGEDVTDAVLAFGGDEDPAGVEAALGSSVDPRFPRPRYGRLMMSNGKMTQTAKRLGLEPVQGTGMDTILFFGDVPLSGSVRAERRLPPLHEFSRRRSKRLPAVHDRRGDSEFDGLSQNPYAQGSAWRLSAHVLDIYRAPAVSAGVFGAEPGVPAQAGCHSRALQRPDAGNGRARVRDFLVLRPQRRGKLRIMSESFGRDHVQQSFLGFCRGDNRCGIHLIRTYALAMKFSQRQRRVLNGRLSPSPPPRRAP